MTEEIKTELLQMGEKYFMIPKQSWTQEELNAIYAMYNKIHGSNKQDTGCGSCRRETITDVRDNYILAKRIQVGGASMF